MLLLYITSCRYAVATLMLIRHAFGFDTRVASVARARMPRYQYLRYAAVRATRVDSADVDQYARQRFA